MSEKLPEWTANVRDVCYHFRWRSGATAQWIVKSVIREPEHEQYLQDLTAALQSGRSLGALMIEPDPPPEATLRGWLESVVHELEARK